MGEDLCFIMKSSVFICNLFCETNTWFLFMHLSKYQDTFKILFFPTHCYLSGDMFETLLVEYMIPLSGDGLSYQISIQIWHIKDFPYTVHTLKALHSHRNLQHICPCVHMGLLQISCSKWISTIQSYLNIEQWARVHLSR